MLEDTHAALPDLAGKVVKIAKRVVNAAVPIIIDSYCLVKLSGCGVLRD